MAYSIHLMTAHEGNICFVSQESIFAETKSRETSIFRGKQNRCFLREAVIKCFVI